MDPLQGSFRAGSGCSESLRRNELGGETSLEDYLEGGGVGRPWPEAAGD